MTDISFDSENDTVDRIQFEIQKIEKTIRGDIDYVPNRKERNSYLKTMKSLKEIEKS